MLNVTLDSLGLETVRGDESFVSRVQDMPVSKEEFFDLTKMAKYVGVTEQLRMLSTHSIHRKGKLLQVLSESL